MLCLRTGGRVGHALWGLSYSLEPLVSADGPCCSVKTVGTAQCWFLRASPVGLGPYVQSISILFQPGPHSFSCLVAGTSGWNLPPFSLLCPCLLSLNTVPNYFYHLPWSFMLLSLQRSFLFQYLYSSVFSIFMILLENVVLVPAGGHCVQLSSSGLQPTAQAD